MHFQFIVAPPTPALLPPASPSSEMPTELLTQLIDIQREQLSLMQAQAVAGSDNAQVRWRNFFERWQGEFPEMSESVREVLPTVERAYLRLMTDMVHQLKEDDGNALDDDFSVGEFLDRYAMRASQIGTILNLLGQMAEAGRGDE